MSILVLQVVLLLFIAASSDLKSVVSRSNEHVVATTKLSSESKPSGFISIDCGETEDHEDNGMLFQKDEIFTDAGVNRLVSSDYRRYGGDITVRTFPIGKRNCYTLKPNITDNSRIMIRAEFRYGNYDGKNRIPNFDLHIGVNYWTTINMDRPGDYVYKDIIYNPQIHTSSVDVCLVNTGSGEPFISALFLRVLDSSMYEIDGHFPAIKSKSRFDVGRLAADGNLEYPYDVYDRTWEPLFPKDDTMLSSGLEWVKTTFPQNDDDEDKNKVPDVVWRTAARAKNGSKLLNLNVEVSNDVNSSSPYYVYLYFSELEKLPEGRKRSMNIFLRDELAANVILEYLHPVTVGPLEYMGYPVNFSIYAVDGAQGPPPMLNGVEIYRKVEPWYSPTALEDVSAMMDIKKTYKVSRNWQGDPCVPSDLSWDGLSCTSTTIPRIISLNLSSCNLSGELSITFSRLRKLTLLDLSYNELTGPVPDFLAELKDLKLLNLTGNKFSGSVPLALKEKFKDTPAMLSLEGNPNLCRTDSCHNKNKKLVVPLVASAVSLLFVAALLTALVVFWRKKKDRPDISITSNREEPLKLKNSRFSYAEVSSITDNFKTVIGEGGFGKVYHGFLADETQVAVKLLSTSSHQGYKEFRAEAQLLMVVHHRNLVSLVGYCDEDENKALIYEYMANGNVRQHLSEKNEKVLNWRERLEVAVDSAQGLEYLHNGCKPPIIHRDLKTSNILLDAQMKAKIADFGLSRAFATDTDSHVSTNLAGTPGYLDPEAHASGTLNKKSDVYSFGIILFELITGQPAIIRGVDVESSIHILDWINPVIETGDIGYIMDPRLQGDFNINAAWKAVEVAMSCVSSSTQRPDMSHVLAELKVSLEIEMSSGKTLTNMDEKNRKISSDSLVSMAIDDNTAPYAR